MAEKPQVGDSAPDFTAPVAGGSYTDGDLVSLSDLTGGKPIVLYFYPKDDTPGCTKQACAIRDEWTALAEKAQLFGVSIDPIQKHRKFIDKYDLTFPLLSDENKALVEAYGVWVEKSMYGKTYLGTERTTFVIAADGKVQAIFPKVKPADHLGKLLAELG